MQLALTKIYGAAGPRNQLLGQRLGDRGICLRQPQGKTRGVVDTHLVGRRQRHGQMLNQ